MAAVTSWSAGRLRAGKTLLLLRVSTAFVAKIAPFLAVYQERWFGGRGREHYAEPAGPAQAEGECDCPGGVLL